MKLHYAPQTRAGTVKWMLEELAVDYEIVDIDYKSNAHKTEDYLKIHPLGLLPALEDDGQVIYERAAILHYLADKYEDRGLIPAKGTPERALFYQWMTFAVATFEPTAMTLFREGPNGPPDRETSPEREEFDRVLTVLENGLKGPYFLGDQFTAVDIQIGHGLMMMQNGGLLNRHPSFDDYLERLNARPKLVL